MKTITVEIDTDGTVELDLKGFHGKGCGKVFEDFVAGSKVVIQHTKPEFFEEQKQTQKAGGA